MTFPNSDKGLTIDSIPNSINYSIHVGSDNCLRYKQVSDSVNSSTANLSSQNQVRKSYEANFLPRLRMLTEMPDADTATMFDVQDYLVWATISNLNLKF